MTRVMIVEDEPFISMELQEIIESLGYNVAGCAVNGDESIEMARQLKPDIILMDIIMPGEKDGIEAALVIKKESDIPIIFVTAWSDKKYTERAKQVQPYGYIIKPFKEREIGFSIEFAIYKKQNELLKEESLQRFQSVINLVNDAILFIGRKSEVLFSNSFAEKLFDYSSLKGKYFIDLIAPDHRKSAESLINRIFENKYNQPICNFENLVGLKKDGREFPHKIITWYLSTLY